MKIVGTRLKADIGNAALRVAEAGIEGGCLYLEFRDHVRWGNIGRNDFVRICRRRTGSAVDRQVAAVGASAIHGETDNVGRLKWTVESRITCEGYARGETNEVVGLAVWHGQL